MRKMKVLKMMRKRKISPKILILLKKTIKTLMKLKLKIASFLINFILDKLFCFLNLNIKIIEFPSHSRLYMKTKYFYEIILPPVIQFPSAAK